MQCIWDISWVGQCKQEAVKDDLCEKHKDKTCTRCGRPAIRECEATLGAFVCGESLCGSCHHGY